MPQRKIIPFTTDLIDFAQSLVRDNSILVYPTHLSAQIAEHRAFNEWNLDSISYFSMGDFIQSVMYYQKPLLEEDKRLICLYRSLNQEDRDFFHVYGYQDIVSWGQNFLRFFDELAEECVSIEKLMAMKDSGAFYLQYWQELFIDRIIDIRERYHCLITDLGFIDSMFYDTEDIQIDFTGRQLIFVNQYYFSQIERAIISKLEDMGNSVLIIHQGNPDSYNYESKRGMKLDIARILQDKNFVTESVDIFICENEDKMILEFLNQRSNLSEDTVILDSKFHTKAYSSIFVNNKLCKCKQTSFTETLCFQLLKRITEDLNAIHRSLDRKYIPVQNILEIVSRGDLCAKFSSAKQKDLMNELMLLIRDDVLYIDLSLQIFEGSIDYEVPNLKAFLNSYFSWLEAFSQVLNIKDLTLLIDSEALQLREMFTDEEYQYSNAPEMFLERLANFVSVETLGLVDDWGQLITNESIASGILSMFLQGFKTVTVKTSKETSGEYEYELTNLLDTRNRTFDGICVFNCIEGEMPSAPEAVWLLNETQRKQLGLKTFDDIRIWEHYYFFRMLLCSNKVYLFSFQNQEKAIEPSSFISELIYQSENAPEALHISPSPFKSSNKDRMYVGSIYESYRKNHLSRLPDFNPGDIADKDSFFNIPLNVDHDFGEKHEVRLGFYSLNQMIKSPFIWYLFFMRKTNDPIYKVEETLTRKLFGSLIHDYLSRLMAEIHGSQIDYPRVLPHFNDKSTLKTKLIEVLSQDKYRYKIPQNYNYTFLVEIISDCIVDTIYWFFNKWMVKLIGSRQVTLLPEQDSDRKKPYKLLTDIDGVKIYIKGIADLRIESTDVNYIIDFKTGNHDQNQLLFYEWYYYLLDNPDYASEIKGVFCKVLQMEAEPVFLSDKQRDKYTTAITDTFASLMQNGYTISSKLSDRLQYASITRADLYGSKIGE